MSNPPATFYGLARPGDRVEANIGGTSCASATAGADGFWMMQVPEGGACGAKEGAIVRFTLNGSPSPVFEVWRAGGGPKSIAAGIDLREAADAT